MQEQDDLPAGTTLASLRRRWWLIVVCLVVGAGIAAYHARSKTAYYEATAQIQFGVNTSVLQALGVPTANETNQSSVIQATNDQAAGLAVIGQYTAHALGSQVPSNGIDVSVSAVGTTNLANITAQAPTAASAVLVANTYAQQVVTYNQQQQEIQVAATVKALKHELHVRLLEGLGHQSGSLETTLANLQGILATNPVDVIVAQPASSASRASRKTTTRALEGALAGLIVGLIAALLLDWADPRLRALEQIPGARIPVVSPRLLKNTPRHSVLSAAAIRILRAARVGSRGGGTVLALATAPGRRDADAARNLALALADAAARGGKDVALIRMQQQPDQRDELSPENAESTSDALATFDALPILRAQINIHFDVLELEEGALVTDYDAAALCAELRSRYSVVIVDMPVGDDNSAAAGFIAAADAVAMVVLLGKSRRRSVALTLGQLSAQRLDVMLVGLPAGTRFGGVNMLRPAVTT